MISQINNFKILLILVLFLVYFYFFSNLLFFSRSAESNNKTMDAPQEKGSPDDGFLASSPMPPYHPYHPYFITGFLDGESCFSITIRKNLKCIIGWSVGLTFTIVLHKKDLLLLKSIQESLDGVGSITKHGKDSIQLQVTSKKDLAIIIKHLERFPLITQKFADYLIFKQAFEIYSNREHLTLEGLKKLVAIKSEMNLGLSDELKKAFPSVKPVARPLVLGKTIKDPN